MYSINKWALNVEWRWGNLELRSTEPESRDRVLERNRGYDQHTQSCDLRASLE